MLATSRSKGCTHLRVYPTLREALPALPERQICLLQKQRAVRASFQNYPGRFKDAPDAWHWVFCDSAQIWGVGGNLQ
jgi:hypothetical protein